MPRTIDENLDRLVNLAREDLSCGETEKAKQRLRSLLRRAPRHSPALAMMGEIYYSYGDHRNAVMYWSQAECWCREMWIASEHVFRSTARALAREQMQVVRHNLYAFAGSSPPSDLARRLAVLKQAYYMLDEKRAKLSGLACAPLAGALVFIFAGAMAGLAGGGWSSITWLAVSAVAATLVTFTLNVRSYFSACRRFKESIASFYHHNL
ncbi:MAG: tetratricopeptide repeat protein [Armatimonadota bacterium]